MFPSTDSPKNAVDMFPRTDTLKWHSFYPLKPCWDYSIDVKKIRREIIRLLKQMVFRILKEILKTIFLLEKYLVGTY